jgi:hypothetical protein
MIPDMSAMRRRFHPTGDDLMLRELHARYYEAAHRVRPDNPRDVVLLKVQRRRWVANLLPSRGREAALRYPAVQQLDKLIEDWYTQHSEFSNRGHRARRPLTPDRPSV